MLFTYKWFDFPLCDIQEALDILFCEIWCNADEDDLMSHVKNHPRVFEFFECMKDSRQADPTKRQYTPLGLVHVTLAKEIYSLFKSLPEVRRNTLKKDYLNSQDIERCLTGQVTPLSKDDLERICPELSNKLEQFFFPLWDSNLLTTTLMTVRYKTKKQHYEAFDKVNNSDSCAYCGMSEFYTANDEYREAYDHFLPKKKYYLSAMNFRNLTPMCGKCNEDAKQEKDPLYSCKKRTPNRQKVFYPYAEHHPSISIKARIKTCDINNACPIVHIELGPDAFNEQLESWDEIFNVKSRFVSYISKKYQSLIKIGLEKCNYKKEALPQAMREMKEVYSIFPYTEGNFLKIACIDAYLDACQQSISL